MKKNPTTRTITKNGGIKTNYVFLDLDFPFDRWKTSRNALQLKEIVTNLKDEGTITKACIRRSASGHVHMAINFSKDLTTLEHFATRAFLGDDAHRLACDLCRYHLHEDINRLFDEKYVGSEIRKAGKWEKWL